MEVTYSSSVRVMTYILPSMLCSILLNIPKFLEAKIDKFEYLDDDNVTHETVLYNVTSLRLNPDYMYYYIHWTRLLCTGLIPFIYLSYMNMLIYTRMRKNNLSMVRSRLSSTMKATNLAAILIVIVVVFLVSHTPRLILNLTEFAVHGEGKTISICGCDITPIWYLVTISINHLFLTINRFSNYHSKCHK